MEKNRHCDVLYYILGEFETLKLDSEKFKTFLLDNTGKSSELVKEVVQGKADAALLPACFLEQHVVEYPSLYREIKVLNPLRSSELPCTVSTTLYPNWSVLITPNISMKQATRQHFSLSLKAVTERGGLCQLSSMVWISC